MRQEHNLSQRLNQTVTDAMMAALRAVHASTAPETLENGELERQRKGQEILGRLVTPPIGFSWEPFRHRRLPMAWVRPERGHDPDKVILYCHGGGYISGNLGYARVLAAKMASATGREVLSFEYRLAPEHPWPAAAQDAMAAWDYLMYQGYGAGQVVLAGDSAGGNLALELALELRRTGRRLPARLVLFSPWTDMTAQGNSYQTCREEDPMLTQGYIHAARQAYAPGKDWNGPEFSPLFADLRGLPPTLIQVGGREILHSDSTRLRDRLQEAGVPCVLECWPEMWHVFQMFPLRQAAQAMEGVARFLQW